MKLCNVNNRILLDQVKGEGRLLIWRESNVEGFAQVNSTHHFLSSLCTENELGKNGAPYSAATVMYGQNSGNYLQI